jgi:hypothetical protein
MLVHEIAEKHELEHKSKGNAQERHMKNSLPVTNNYQIHLLA